MKVVHRGAGIAPWLVHQTSDQKVAGSSPGGEFSSPRSTFCPDSYFSIHSTPMLLKYHVKHPSHSAKGAGSRLHLNTHVLYVSGFA